LGGQGRTGPLSDETKKKLIAVRARYWSDPKNHEKRRESSKKMWTDSNLREKISRAIKDAPGPTRFKSGDGAWNAGTKGVMKPNSGSFAPGHIKSPNSGAKGPNSGSFQKGHKLGVGREFSEEHIRNLSLSHIGQIAPNKGKKHSLETRQKMQAAWTRRRNRSDYTPPSAGLSVSNNTRQKMRESAKAAWMRRKTGK